MWARYAMDATQVGIVYAKVLRVHLSDRAVTPPLPPAQQRDLIGRMRARGMDVEIRFYNRVRLRVCECVCVQIS